MKKLLPLLLGIIGLGTGLGAGIFLKEPEPEPAEDSTAEEHAPAKKDSKSSKHDKDDHGDHDDEADKDVDYIKLNNQFVVPLVADGAVVSLVVLSLSLEVDPGNEEMIYEREPKVRDAFLRVLFDHANAGGFSGDFTRLSNMIVLRDSLREIARKTLGDVVQNVLIIDLVRQDN